MLVSTDRPIVQLSILTDLFYFRAKYLIIAALLPNEMLVSSFSMKPYNIQ